MARFGGAVPARIAGLAVGSVRTAIVTAAARHVYFTADDGFDAATGGLVVKLLGGKQITVVGDGHGGHASPGRLGHQFGDFTSAVEKAVVSMKMKMDEARSFHAGVIVVCAPQIFQTRENLLVGHVPIMPFIAG